jgi:hypothetical protein
VKWGFFNSWGIPLRFKALGKAFYSAAGPDTTVNITFVVV